MTIRHLSIYKTVCEEMSVTKAAERLFMTQPAVSHVIAALEKEAGTPLFDRRSQKIYINERGKALLQKAVRLLELYEELERELPSLERGAPLRLGSSITIASFWLPEILKTFESGCPDVPVNVVVDSAFHTASRLERGEIDIGLVEGACYLEAFEKIPFSSYGIIPLCAPGFSGFYGEDNKRTLDMKTFSSLPLLLREKGSAVRDVLDGAFLQRELESKPCWTSVNSQALLRAAEAGMGIAVLPDILARRELLEGRLISLEVEGLSLFNHNYIAYHRSNYMTAPMKAFVELVTGEA